jgi:hypothetical protein
VCERERKREREEKESGRERVCVCERERAKKRNEANQFIGMFSIFDVFLLDQKFRITNAGTKKKSEEKTYFVNRP